jgi:plasmid stabilization system protein ParE
VVVKGHKVVIANDAKAQLRQAYNYICNDSARNAEKVKDQILSSIKGLAINPEKHPPDQYKVDNDGSFRAYELFRYRISYHISDVQITVIRIRHTKMNPLHY